MTSPRLQKKNGFTLIEIMVAISIFVMVAFIVTSTLLVILDAGRRANKIRLIVDNMNFALDSMTVKMKFGTDYVVNPNGKEIEFTDRDGNLICYKGEKDKSEKDKNNGGISKCFGGCDGSCQSITTSEIDVSDLIFEESKCFNLPCKNSEILVFVKAEAKIKNQTPTKLEFQTAVSQAQSN